MERSDYPAMLAIVAPTHAVDILNERVAHIGRLNAEVAEWLTERRRLEEGYAMGLRKLARRPIQGVDLGVFSVPWTQLTNATESQADSHSSLATKIETDVERPLRDFAKSNREMQAMTTMQGNMGALAKDVDSAQSKLDKLQGRGERADPSRIAAANQDVENAQIQWETQAPYVFQDLQALDEIRLNHFRDVLTQLQTHEVDQIEKDRVSAEQCLNVLLNVEIADEIKTYTLKAVANKPRVDRAARPPPSSSAGEGGGRPALNSTPSQISANDEASSIQDEDKKKKGGLKRFSTVLGRRKDKPSKTQLEPMSEQPESKSRGLFGRKKKDAINLDSVAEDSSSPGRPYPPDRIGSEAFEPPASRQETLPPATNGTAALQNGSHQNELAGLEAPRPQPPMRTDSLPKQDSEGFSIPQQNTVDPITQAQRDASQSSGPLPQINTDDGFGMNIAPQYNVRIADSPVVADPPVDADAALASMASKLQMQAPPPQRRAGTVRGRRDGRNSAFIGAETAAASITPPTNHGFEPSPATQSFTPPPPAATLAPVASSSSSTAFDPSASTTRSFEPAASTSSFAPRSLESAPAAAAAASSSPSASFTPFNPSASTMSAFSAMDNSPMKPVPRTLNPDTTTTGDNASIRSGRSLASTTSQAHKHPELASSGLNASIIETVSARFDDGKLTTSSVTGEIALAYNHPPPTTTGSSSTSTMHHQALDVIRIENYASLDKVAPNPAFVLPVTDGREGEYNVNLAAIIAKTQVAFKYQARLNSDDDESAEQAPPPPLLITTAYRIEPTQTSVIVSYALNPAFFFSPPVQGSSSSSGGGVKLSNVMLALTLEGAKAASCQSKPVGTFSREKNLIFWQLGEVNLVRGSAPVKLLARFATTTTEEGGGGEAKAGSVEARWEITGEQALQLGSALAITSQNAAHGDGSDPFADENGHGNGSGGGFKPVHTVKKLASGSYVAR